MELTISRQELEARRTQREAIWFAPASDGGDVYWAASARGSEDFQILLAVDLFQFAPAEGELTLRVGLLSVYDTDYWARLTWLDRSFDLVVITGFSRWPYVRVFGQLEHDVTRRQIGVGEDSLACLPGGIWRLVSVEGDADIASAWCGAAGLMA